MREIDGLGSWGGPSLFAPDSWREPALIALATRQRCPGLGCHHSKHLALREYVLPGKVDVTLVKGALPYASHSVRTRKRTEVQSRLARNNLLWPPAGKLESDREGPCPGQKLCYLLLRSQEGRKRYTELEGEVPPSHFSSARPWPP